ncbi:hypothetical protein Ais01nite_05100 [Asanoa ishikariensis]|uniref:Alpha/beta hydrolase family protein n=1 Tax=Asanoa ishikariensis TaxID=137265 RepID=A0A1H3TGM3_9ACTN|nr:alpha/beta hydrolase [Asanoa ishikariensis]GIF62475.1 hypothetical protein Ais01nite_05100 [Asanoa ishikariensis]SDZ49376.1 hypothetical protein SAMN05421684_5722 [Asanoa ishikariensis]
MAPNAVIVHGMPPWNEFYDPTQPSPSNHHWLPWLAKQLIIREIPAHTPEMPHAFRPEFGAWSREFARYDVGPETLLVGHSCGAGFLVRWLTEHPAVRVGRVLLVAPFLDPTGRRATGMRFREVLLRPTLVGQTAGLTILHSDDDNPDIQRSVAELRAALPDAGYVEVHGRGHLADGPGSTLPEALVALGLGPPR